MKLPQRIATFASALGFSVFAALPTFASDSTMGPYTNALSECLIESTPHSQRVVLAQGLFASLASHPDMSSVATVSASRRVELNQSVAQIFETLLTASCVSEAQQAVKYEGATAIETSLSFLWSAAGRELYDNPNVNSSMADLINYIDGERVSEVLTTAKRDFDPSLVADNLNTTGR